MTSGATRCAVQCVDRTRRRGRSTQESGRRAERELVRAGERRGLRAERVSAGCAASAKSTPCSRTARLGIALDVALAAASRERLPGGLSERAAEQGRRVARAAGVLAIVHTRRDRLTADRIAAGPSARRGRDAAGAARRHAEARLASSRTADRGERRPRASDLDVRRRREQSALLGLVKRDLCGQLSSQSAKRTWRR